MGDDVVHLHDEGVFDAGEKLLFGLGGRDRVGVAGVEQAFEHHPSVGDVAVAGEVDPAEPAVGERADDLVLPGHEVAGVKFGCERVGVAALGAVALGTSGHVTVGAAYGCAATGAVAFALGHHRVEHHRIGGIGHRRAGHMRQARAQPGGAGTDRAHPPPRRRAPRRTQGDHGRPLIGHRRPRRAGLLLPRPAGRRRRGRPGGSGRLGRSRRLVLRRDHRVDGGHGARRAHALGSRKAAVVAVTVDVMAGTPRLGAAAVGAAVAHRRPRLRREPV